MNPEPDDQLTSEKEATGDIQQQQQHPLDQSMSDDEENIRSPEDLSLRQTPQQSNTTAQATTNSTTRPNQSPEMIRTAAKELIERYFYQLQRGCGNPKCSNVNCASSGKVAPMTANEMAAKAIQLFSRDAKLCDCTNQPPKVARRLSPHESPTSSRSVSHNNTMPLTINEAMDTYTQQQDHCSSASSSSASNSTITSGSSSSTTSSSSTGSSNTNISSCATEEMPLLVALGETSTPTISNHAHATGSSNLQATNSVATLTKTSSDPPTPTLAIVEYLNEQILDDLIEECKKYDSYDRLVHALNEVLCSVQKLSKSFRRPPLVKLTSTATASKLQEILGKSPQDLKKEDLRTLEGEHDKDEDSSCVAQGAQEEEDSQQLTPEHNLNNASANAAGSSSNSTSEILFNLFGRASGGGGGGSGSIGGNGEPMDEDNTSSVDLDDIVEWSHNCDTMVDFESLRRVKKKLHALKKKQITEALNDNIVLLAESVKYGRFYDWDKVLHCFVICFDISTSCFNSFTDFGYLERSMPKLCQAAQVMPVKAQARLARIWATHCKDQFQQFINSLQQLITLQVVLDEDSVQENPDVIAITKVLKIVFYANILAGEIDTYNPIIADKTADSDGASSSGNAASSSNDEDDIFLYNQIIKPYHHPAFAEDKLEKELNINCMDCRVPLVPFEEFYNETLSEAIQMDRDYLSYKNLSLDPLGEENHFSFMLYSFVLTPATKVIALYYDSRIRMFSELNSSIFSMISSVGDINDMVYQPNLKLKVRRDNIVNDALIGLELVAMSNPKDLKKQLVVEFVGEQGIDEGGVSKEFFQLIVEEIFNPDFGMFTHQEDTNTMWFNSTPFENEAQFTLIGIILGLAIYNNIILAVNFPRVVYRKLMGGRGSFYDLHDWNPTLYRSLKSLLDYQETDMEEVFMQTFKISYKNVFDEVVEHDLKQGGGDIAVNQENKQEFVDLYTDYLLNRSIERQFKAFKKGFEMVTDESPLKLLFRPEEIELLVCGSTKFDFVELEISTEYEGGYTKETQIIKDFWSIVHNLPEESKRKLLEFTTGSDRVPVGGLSRLKLLITRNGPDSDRLPTSHTCFNVLLLPEYSSKEKLEERLLKAINYSKGFGML